MSFVAVYLLVREEEIDKVTFFVRQVKEYLSISHAFFLGFQPISMIFYLVGDMFSKNNILHIESEKMSIARVKMP